MVQIPKRRVGGPAWRPGDPTLTVGQIAERLRPIAPDVETTVQRIRHWTRERMMLPVGALHGGTGKHRLYAADNVYSAAILHVFTAFGLNISTVRILVEGLTLARLKAPTWKKKRGPLYLTVWWRSPSRAKCWVDEEEPKLEDLKVRDEEPKPSDLMLVIDLAQLWGRIEGG